MKRKSPSLRTLNRAPEYLTTREVAALLGLTPDTVRKYCERGVIKAGKPGGRWIIHRDNIKTIGG